MARSSECTEQYAQKVFDRDPHCQRRLLTSTIRYPNPLGDILSRRQTTAMSDDDTYISKALAEYREDSGDDRDFVDLEAEVQHEILKQAQGLKTEREREKRG